MDGQQFLILVKSLTMVALVIACAAVGMAPCLLDRCSRRSAPSQQLGKYDPRQRRRQECTHVAVTLVHWFVLLTQGLAAGVLLAGGLLHVLPECQEGISTRLSELYFGNVSTSYDFIYLHTSYHDRWSAWPAFTAATNAGAEPTPEIPKPWFVTFPWASACFCLSLAMLIYSEDIITKHFADINHSHGDKQHSSDDNGTSGMSTRLLTPNDDDGRAEAMNGLGSEPGNTAYHRSNSIHNDNPAFDPLSASVNSEYHRLDNKRKQRLARPTRSVLSAFVLWLSLGVHATVEGLALGIISDTSRLWTLLMAVLLHKLFETFALGSVLKDAFPGKRAPFLVALIALFSLMAPLGIGIGMVVSSVENVHVLLARDFLLSFAAGAFVTMAIEMLRGHEHHPHDDNQKSTDKHSHKHKHRHRLCQLVLSLFKFCLFVAGFVGMGCLVALS